MTSAKDAYFAMNNKQKFLSILQNKPEVFGEQFYLTGAGISTIPHMMLWHFGVDMFKLLDAMQHEAIDFTKRYRSMFVKSYKLDCLAALLQDLNLANDVRARRLELVFDYLLTQHVVPKKLINRCDFKLSECVSGPPLRNLNYLYVAYVSNAPEKYIRLLLLHGAEPYQVMQMDQTGKYDSVALLYPQVLSIRCTLFKLPLKYATDVRIECK